MNKIYLTRRLPAAAMQILERACAVNLWDDEIRPVPRAELLCGVADAEGLLSLITDRIDAEVLDAAPRLRVVANMAVGYDNVDLPALNARRVLLTNTPGVLTETTADLAWALMFAAARRIVEGQKLIEADAWGPLVSTPAGGAGSVWGDPRRCGSGTDRISCAAPRPWIRHAPALPQSPAQYRAGG